MTDEISRAGIFSLLRDFKKKDRQEEGLRIIGTEHIWRVREGPIRTSLVSWLNHLPNLPELLKRNFHGSPGYLTDSWFIISLM
jgi:hypothetical protein